MVCREPERQREVVSSVHRVAKKCSPSMDFVLRASMITSNRNNNNNKNRNKYATHVVETEPNMVVVVAAEHDGNGHPHGGAVVC